jgi:hypothetical protein
MVKLVADGLYPTNPLLSMAPTLILLFEILVITIESIIIVAYLEEKLGKEKFNKWNIIFIVTVANIVTFLLGVLIQYMLTLNVSW